MRYYLARVVTSFAVLFLVWAGLDAAAARQAAIGQSCVQTTAGNLIVSPGENRAHMATQGHEAVAAIEAYPKKVTLAEDLPGSTLICRETATGAACATIDQLFKGKN